jgi:hypothetical protein
MFESDETRAAREEIKTSFKQFVQLATGVGALVKLFIFASSFVGEVFLRGRLGLRHLLLSGLFASIAMALFSAFWCSGLGLLYNESFSVFVIMYSFAWVFHVIAWFRRSEPTHDGSYGHPSGLWVGWFYPRYMGGWMILYVVEPGLWLLAGSIVGVSAPMLGVWMLLVGGSLFLKMVMLGSELRAQIQEAINRELDAQAMRDAVSAAKKQQQKAPAPWVVGGQGPSP